MPKGFKRKRSRKGMSHRRKGGYKRSKFGFGPVGGVRGGHFGTTQTIVRSPTVNADRLFCSFQKTEVGQLQTGAAGGFVTQQIKLNSCNNPLGTIVAGTPVGFSTYCGTASPAPYHSYIVHAVRVEAQLVSGSLFSTVGFSPRIGAAATPANMNAMASVPRAVCLQCLPGEIRTYRKYFTIGQIAGQSPQTVAIADSFAGQAGADPASLVYLDVGLFENSNTTQVTYSLIIKITQWVELFGRNQVA